MFDILYKFIRNEIVAPIVALTIVGLLFYFVFFVII